MIWVAENVIGQVVAVQSRLSAVSATEEPEAQVPQQLSPGAQQLDASFRV